MRVYLQGEGITLASDLGGFLSNDAWSQIVENYKRPSQVAGQGGAYINQAPFQLPAKSLIRLKIVSKVVDYYNKTSRAITPDNMTWARLSNF